MNVFVCQQGKDLFMDLDEGALKLIDPENLTVLNTQPIHTIRVWGVGRDNGRYVIAILLKLYVSILQEVYSNNNKFSVYIF